MLNDSIKTLAATPPPAHRLWRFKTSSTATARINELEARLGLPLSGRSFNLNFANARIVELEAMLAAKSVPPNADAPAQTIATNLTGRARFAASCAADAAAKPKSQSHPELHGRARFAADVRIASTPQILSANVGAEKKEMKGRAKFNAAVARDFSTNK
jgi:hypothetical protein